LIKVENITKKYGDFTAVDNMSFTIEPGHIYGFLGPNGAGKTTTMGIITGTLGATRGKVLIDGDDILDEPIKSKSKIGYLPENPPVYLDMTVYEYLCFVAGAKGMHGQKMLEDVEYSLEKTQLSVMRHRLIKQLSKGYKQRVGIAQAMLGDPEIIILDEPTVGLDPRQIIYIRELIKDLGKTKTIILSSHILSEISAVCDRIMIISGGKLLACDTLENLKNSFLGPDVINLIAKGPEQDVMGILKNVDGAYNVTVNTDINDGYIHAELKCNNSQDIREAIFKAFAKAGLPLLELSRKVATLEDVFLKATDSSNSSYDYEYEEDVTLNTLEDIGELLVKKNNTKHSYDDEDEDDDNEDEDEDDRDFEDDDEDDDGDDYKPLFH